MKTLSVYEAKNKLSRVIADAEIGEATVITKNGKDAAVVVPIEEYRKDRAGTPSFVDFLLDERWRGLDLEIERSKDIGREPPDFS